MKVYFIRNKVFKQFSFTIVGCHILLQTYDGLIISASFKNCIFRNCHSNRSLMAPWWTAPRGKWCIFHYDLEAIVDLQLEGVIHAQAHF